MPTGGNGEGGVTEQIRELTERMSLLVRDHVELAKAEAVASAKVAAKDSALIVAGVLLAALGWVLLMFAAGYALGSRIGFGWGFLVVAAVHLAAGGALAAVYGQRLSGRDKPAMPQTTQELARDRRFARRLGRTIRQGS